MEQSESITQNRDIITMQNQVKVHFYQELMLRVLEDQKIQIQTKQDFKSDFQIFLHGVTTRSSKLTMIASQLSIAAQTLYLT